MRRMPSSARASTIASAAVTIG
jgi:hypothetical protein